MVSEATAKSVRDFIAANQTKLPTPAAAPAPATKPRCGLGGDWQCTLDRRRRRFSDVCCILRSPTRA